MIVNCPGCNCKYNIPSEKIGDSPKRFRCRKCSEIFMIHPLKPKMPEIPPIPVEIDENLKHAMRFARVLASDMLVYNREIIEKARDEGNLPEVMEREIRKSWELWESRFPKESKTDPGIFSNALNYYLAEGEEVFRNQTYS